MQNFSNEDELVSIKNYGKITKYQKNRFQTFIKAKNKLVNVKYVQDVPIMKTNNSNNWFIKFALSYQHFLWCNGYHMKVRILATESSNSVEVSFLFYLFSCKFSIFLAKF